MRLVPSLGGVEGWQVENMQHVCDSGFHPNFYSICSVDFVQRLLHDMQLAPRAVSLLLLRLLLYCHYCCCC